MYVCIFVCARILKCRIFLFKYLTCKQNSLHSIYTYTSEKHMRCAHDRHRYQSGCEGVFSVATICCCCCVQCCLDLVCCLFYTSMVLGGIFEELLLLPFTRWWVVQSTHACKQQQQQQQQRMWRYSLCLCVRARVFPVVVFYLFVFYLFISAADARVFASRLWLPVNTR